MPSAVHCPRCGVACQEHPPQNADARLLLFGTLATGGMCVDCAVTEWIQSTDVLMVSIDTYGARILLIPYIQQEFAALMAVGNADATAGEIDWQKVVDNWALPMPRPRRKRTA